MNIVTLNANFKGMGTYQRCFYFSWALASAGHNVTMVTVSRTSKYKAITTFKRGWADACETPSGRGPWVRMIEAPNLGFKWLPGWGSGPLDILLRTREICAGHYDVVYGFEYQPNVSWPVYLTRSFDEFRFISDWCDWYAGESNALRGNKLAHRIDAFFEERIRCVAHHLTVISRVLQERAAALGIDRSRISLIPQGVDTEYVRVLPQADARRSCGLPQEGPIVLAVNDGDMRNVIRIFAGVLRTVPDALAVLVGNISADARQYAKQLGVDAQVVCTGWVNDEEYVEYLGAADVCILPLEDRIGNRARFPAKILDYFAAGKPAVTGNVGAVADLVREHRIGVVVDGDQNEFATAVSRLLLDRQRCQELGAEARRLMVSQWEWSTRTPHICAVVQPNNPVSRSRFEPQPAAARYEK